MKFRLRLFSRILPSITLISLSALGLEVKQSKTVVMKNATSIVDTASVKTIGADNTMHTARPIPVKINKEEDIGFKFLTFLKAFSILPPSSLKICIFILNLLYSLPHKNHTHKSNYSSILNVLSYMDFIIKHF